MQVQTIKDSASVMGNQTKLFLGDNVGFVELIEVFGSDLTVVNAARVSFYKESCLEPILQEQDNQMVTVGYQLSDRDSKLIEYLATHKHIAPFFHPQLRFRIKMPIFVAREWYRHTVGFTRNEVSRRYVTDEPEFFVPQQLRKRNKNVKQGSSSEIIEQNDQVVAEMRTYTKNALAYYNNLLEIGVCPEQARMMLPQSMYTEFIETASLAGYARLVDLRLDGAAQKEIRDYAQFISDLIEPLFPVSWKALLKS
jgi:thymidylate synthase (FAD)